MYCGSQNNILAHQRRFLIFVCVMTLYADILVYIVCRQCLEGVVLESTFTESQNYWGWKEPLEIVYQSSNNISCSHLIQHPSGPSRVD